MLCIGTYYLPGSTKGNKKKSNKDMYTYYKKSVNLLTNMNSCALNSFYTSKNEEPAYIKNMDFYVLENKFFTEKKCHVL